MTKEIVLAAMDKAAKGHSDKRQADYMMANRNAYANSVMVSIASGEYKNQIRYRKLTKTNPNGKVRKIDSPFLFTFVLQHLFNCLTQPIYDKHDNYNGVNCKPGCGITSSDKKIRSFTGLST